MKISSITGFTRLSYSEPFMSFPLPIIFSWQLCGVQFDENMKNHYLLAETCIFVLVFDCKSSIEMVGPTTSKTIWGPLEDQAVWPSIQTVDHGRSFSTGRPLRFERSPSHQTQTWRASKLVAWKGQRNPGGLKLTAENRPGPKRKKSYFNQQLSDANLLLVSGSWVTKGQPNHINLSRHNLTPGRWTAHTLVSITARHNN